MSFPQTVVPIFNPIESGAFDFLGTGTFVLYAGHFFIVTAAHVFDGTKFSQDLLVGVSPEPHTLVRLPRTAVVSPMPASGDRRHDPIDVAVIPISEELMKGLCSTEAVFAILDGRFDKLQIEVGDDVIFAGFPVAAQRMYPFPEGMHIEPPVTKVLYLHQVSAEEAGGIHYDIQRHLVGRYLHPATRPPDFDLHKLKFEPSYGMSGGSIWHRNRERVVLAGIVTSWWPPDDKGYMMGTRLSETRQMFDEALKLIADGTP